MMQEYREVEGCRRKHGRGEWQGSNDDVADEWFSQLGSIGL